MHRLCAEILLNLAPQNDNGVLCVANHLVIKYSGVVASVAFQTFPCLLAIYHINFLGLFFE